MSTNRTLVFVIFAITACGAVAEHDNADAGVSIDAGAQGDGDAGAPVVPEVLSPYDCIPAPGGRADMGDSHGAPMQILLDLKDLYDCYSSNVPPCRGLGNNPSMYECATEDLGGASS